MKVKTQDLVLTAAAQASPPGLRVSTWPPGWTPAPTCCGGGGWWSWGRGRGSPASSPSGGGATSPATCSQTATPRCWTTLGQTCRRCLTMLGEYIILIQNPPFKFSLWEVSFSAFILLFTIEVWTLVLYVMHSPFCTVKHGLHVCLGSM